MIKNIVFVIALYLIFNGCKKTIADSQNENTPIIYTGYSIPVEGGLIEIKVDSITSLEKLVDSLEFKNELYETGKGYWIGYNDLMFSIAVYSDNAIEPLLEFINKTNNREAKVAACYTLHLIGINCTIVGRITEDFHNKNARKALLALLSDFDLQPIVMELLIRDPWQSDIPELVNHLENSEKDCWAISNGLLLYNIEKDKPINRNIPSYINHLYVTVTEKKGGYSIEEYVTIAFSKFKELHSDKVIIEDTLIHYNFWRQPIYNSLVWSSSEKYYKSTSDFLKSESRITIDNLISSISYMDYCDIGNNFQYMMKNEKLYLISAMTLKYIWLDWWKSKPVSYKIELAKNDYKMSLG